MRMAEQNNRGNLEHNVPKPIHIPGMSVGS